MTLVLADAFAGAINIPLNGRVPDTTFSGAPWFATAPLELDGAGHIGNNPPSSGGACQYNLASGNYLKLKFTYEDFGTLGLWSNGFGENDLLVQIIGGNGTIVPSYQEFSFVDQSPPVLNNFNPYGGAANTPIVPVGVGAAAVLEFELDCVNSTVKAWVNGVLATDTDFSLSAMDTPAIVITVPAFNSGDRFRFSDLSVNDAPLAPPGPFIGAYPSRVVRKLSNFSRALPAGFINQ